MRCFGSFLLIGLVMLAVRPFPNAIGGDTTPPRVIVIGFDGFDANLARLWMDEGRLPNLKRLADSGTFAPMPASNPSNSACSWAVATTGRSPGATGLFDFVRRVFGPDGEPRPALAGVGRELVDASTLTPAVRALYDAMRPAAKSPLAGPQPVAVNEIAVPFFWERPEFPEFVGLRMPCAVPARAKRGDRVLAGLFMPDVAGGPGSWAVYTNDDRESANPAGTATDTGGRVFKVLEDERHAYAARVFGPEDFPRVEAIRTRTRDEDLDARRAANDELSKLGPNRRASLAVVFVPDASKRSVEIRMGDERFAVTERAWSPWFHPTFELTNDYRVGGLLRFYVNQCSTGDAGALRFEVFQPAIAYAPRVAGYPNASAPVTYASELARDIGDFSTLGWRSATNAMKDGRIDAQAFLGSVEIALDEDMRLLRHELARKDWRCVFIALGEADQAGHVLLEPKPDASASEELAVFGRTFALADALREVYVECDRFVGEALAEAEAENATLLVTSDHGIAPFRKEADIVSFLKSKHYMSIPLMSAGYDETGWGPEIDWSKTSAYVMGLGTIRINLVGREPKGIVKPEDLHSVLERLRADLLTWTDSETDAKVVRDVWFAEDLFHGDRSADAADVILGFARTYRVSWQNVIGGTALHPTVDHLLRQTTGWTADHCSVDPAAIPGFFASNRKLAIDGTPSVLDLAPTVYAALGLEIPKEFEGRALRAVGEH